MSSPERRKGSAAERQLVKLLRAAGRSASRVPLSGQVTGYKGDVVIVNDDGTRTVIEVKVRGDGFRQLYKWLAANDALAIKADRREWLIVVRLADWTPPCHH
jgi:Holliday junction resolvase